ncbi:4-hydroxybenzoate octaprenyltransferase [Zavarzinia compransoris]|uniref:4-hydroxybenzoate octaprenyltransferase n=1 Tax=Zavarzinia marina TaxID=2911065 RepID=UPI001F226AC7|nr:4-hydroxybenzoate octaprenyltransferase [Zavarzinia marina]MCF4166509.1 4-hydroxybenzoate octaprenyltransferase [Zavarzinia marina]
MPTTPYAAEPGAAEIRPADAAPSTWVDRMPPALRPYLRLARADRPIGIWLLMLPCWWSTALAAPAGGLPDFWLLLLFFVGSAVMRGAGCTLNDIADRDIDARVARTRGRPLPSGAIGVKAAFAFLALQALAGLGVLLSLNSFTIWLGIASLLPVAVYPFMKRITHWPQAMLGIAFNWGALVGWSAVRGDLGWPAVLLYGAGILWTLGYDTIYAHQDKEDDAIVGVKSSALRLGDRTRPFLFAVYGGMVVLVGLAGGMVGLAWPFWLGLGLAALHLMHQAASTDFDDGAQCLTRFKSNARLGFLLFLAIVVGQWAA